MMMIIIIVDDDDYDDDYDDDEEEEYEPSATIGRIDVLTISDCDFRDGI